MSDDFELILSIEPQSGRSYLKAQVRASRLNPVLHPDGSCSARFPSRMTVTSDKRQEIEMSSFQLQSLLEYVERQDYVHNVLATELVRSRADWLDTDEGLEPGEIWKHAHVHAVLFSRRLVRTIEDPKFLSSDELPGLTREDLEEIVALSDKPDTRTSFTVVIDADWDREHGFRTAVFRDGQLIRFGIEPT